MSEQFPSQANLYASQIIVIFTVVLVFFAGVYCRQKLGRKGDGSLNSKQVLVTAVVVFVFAGMPLCQLVHEAILKANTLYAMISSFVPVFAAGISSREEIKKHLAV